MMSRLKFNAMALVLGGAVALAGCAQGPLSFGAADPASPVADAGTGNAIEPDDYRGAGKEFFRKREYGQAEKSFTRAVEVSPSDAESWIGLAATHDQLGRFDLSDRDYAQARKLTGLSAEFLNNRGYSYMLRGDKRCARADFLAAQRLQPDNAFVANNLKLLDEKAAGRT